MKAKKFIESKTEGEYEIKKFHVIDVDIAKDSLKKIIDHLDLQDDYEDAMDKFGVAFDWDEEILYIESGKFVQSVNNWIKEHDDETPAYFIPVLIRLKDCKEYTLYLD